MASFSSITDRVNLLPQSQKILLGIGGLVVIGAILVYLLILPVWRESRKIQEAIAKEKAKVAQINRTRAQIVEFKKELADMDRQYKELSLMLPESREIPLLLKNISSVGQQQGLDFLLIKPEKEIARDLIAEIPITLQFKGPYHQIGVFFDYIRRLPRIVGIKQLELGGFEEKSLKITARCQLVTFRILAQPSPSVSNKPVGPKKSSIFSKPKAPKKK